MYGYSVICTDLKNIYLVEQISYLRRGVSLDVSFFQMHNALIDILNNNNIIVSSKVVEVNKDFLVGHNKTKLIN